MTEWELAYHEVLEISQSYSNITRSILAETDATTLNKELRSNFILKQVVSCDKYYLFYQTAYYLFWRTVAKITWNFVKTLSWKKNYILTGCDVTSKVGTKVSAVASKPENYLEDFGIEPLQEKALNELPPTSSTIRGHLLRSHYFVHLCSNLLYSYSKILEPANYGWIIENGLLVPTISFATVPSYLTTKCRCKKGCTKNFGCKRTFEKCRVLRERTDFWNWFG